VWPEADLLNDPQLTGAGALQPPLLLNAETAEGVYPASEDDYRFGKNRQLAGNRLRPWQSDFFGGNHQVGRISGDGERRHLGRLEQRQLKRRDLLAGDCRRRQTTQVIAEHDPRHLDAQRKGNGIGGEGGRRAGLGVRSHPQLDLAIACRRVVDSDVARFDANAQAKREAILREEDVILDAGWRTRPSHGCGCPGRGGGGRCREELARVEVEVDDSRTVLRPQQEAVALGIDDLDRAGSKGGEVRIRETPIANPMFGDEQHTLGIAEVQGAGIGLQGWE
jgi:hypothetical protein